GRGGGRGAPRCPLSLGFLPADRAPRPARRSGGDTPEEYFEEAQGLADGAGVSFDTVMQVSMLCELVQAQCSMIGAWGTASADGNMHVVRAGARGRRRARTHARTHTRSGPTFAVSFARSLSLSLSPSLFLSLSLPLSLFLSLSLSLSLPP